MEKSDNASATAGLSLKPASNPQLYPVTFRDDGEIHSSGDDGEATSLILPGTAPDLLDICPI
jgi:hypothetical protein